MEISIASNNQVRALETVTAPSILPSHIREDSSAKDFILLIEDYYTWLNGALGPSHAIGNLVKDHDVDLASEDRLDSIERFIASAVPKGRMDRRRLLKNIALYYNTRGSEASVFSFFKIFYNEVVTILYPKEFLFSPSSDKGVTSDRYRIRDSKRWQEFSYELGSALSDTSWRDEYLRFVHPAGMKFFISLTLEAFSKNDWLSDPPESYTDGFEDEVLQDNLWLGIDWNRFFGQHSPKIQPGIESVKRLLFRAFMSDGGLHYLTHVRTIYGKDRRRVDEDLLRSLAIHFTISYRMVATENSSDLFRKDWQIGGKFRDFAAFGEFGNMTIEEGDSDYDPGRGTQFNSFSSYVSSDAFTASYTELEGTDPVWISGGSGSSISEATEWNPANQTPYFNSFTYTSDPLPSQP